MLENWSKINGEPFYCVSDKGRVYDLVKRELIQPTILDGVLTVILLEEYDTPVTHEVQKLVSEHFPKSDEEEDFDEREQYVKITSTSNYNTMVVLSLDELEHWSNSHDISLDAIERVLYGYCKSAGGYRFEYV